MIDHPPASAPLSCHVVEGRHLRVSGLDPALEHQLCERLTLENPKYLDAMEYGRWIGDMAEFLAYYRHGEQGELIIPRGVLPFLSDLCGAHGVRIDYHDDTLSTAPVPFTSHAQLSPAQQRAVEQVLARPMGQLVAPAGAGKTVMGLEIIARRKQPTLWLTHTKELVAQTRVRASEVLGMDPAEVGMIGVGKRIMGARLTIGMVQTLCREVPRELLESVGHVVVDECHHVPCQQMATVVSRFPARYLLGLSATPYRRDGLDDVITFFVGPPVATLTEEELSDRLVQPRIYRRDTGVKPYGDSFTYLVSALTQNTARNALIIDDVVRAVAQGRKCLVLTERVGHARRLAYLLAQSGVPCDVLHGARTRAEREEVRTRLDAGDLSAIVATSALLGEGFDCPRLDTLLLATPLSYHGRLTQNVGRVCRAAPGKADAVVIDYTDDHRMLWASWAKRRDAYDAAGYERTRVTRGRAA